MGPWPLDLRSEAGFCEATFTFPLGCHLTLRRRLYVLVEAEQVHRVVLVLQGHQPLVLAVVREEVLDLLLALVTGEVRGDAWGDVGSHRPHKVTHLGDVDVIL